MQPSDIHPRDVANKSRIENLLRAVDMALSVENAALRLNTQSFNTNRYKAISRLHDYETVKDEARKIKEESIGDLPRLIDAVKKAVRDKGGHVFLAATKQQAVDYVREVCLIHRARLVVKAKSITTEEIELNPALEADHISVAETDLAEFILQVSHEQPSHIVAPAIHRSRERISRLFKQNFETDRPLDTGEQLTEFARDVLREKFLSADIGITGANLISAEEGAILLVESEGNIRLTTHLPAVHIAIAGIEKIVPRKQDFGPFIELLAASGTGQPLTTYTNILEPPLSLPVLNLNGRSDTKREFHLVLVDNGRMAMRADNDLREALYCIRCSACMNVCANFQAVGGHAFGGECYTGGIGAAWTIGTSGSLAKGRFADLCTGCSRCISNCPVRIDIPRLNTVIKHRLIEAGEPALQKRFFGNFSRMARLASLIPRLSSWFCSRGVSKTLLERVVGVDKRRSIPSFASETLQRQFSKHKSGSDAKIKESGRKILLFADVYTQYNNPSAGLSVVRVFEKLGLSMRLGISMEDGRAALSQGLVESAQASAIKVVHYLGPLAVEGYDILFAEPSVLGMVRQDYRVLVKDPGLLIRIQEHCFDPFEYLNRLLKTNPLLRAEIRRRIRHDGTRLFYHGHCQMKSIGIGLETPAFFTDLGFNVSVSTAECCGMAGSFGYKKQYYELSRNIGDDLCRQIDAADSGGQKMVVLASGTSCREQISGTRGGAVLHPIEFLDSVLS